MNIFEKNWIQLSIKEQESILMFIPFKGIINNGEPVIKVYYEFLEKNTNNKARPLSSLLINELSDFGWINKLEEYDKTELLFLQPQFMAFLTKKSKKHFSKHKLKTIDTAYIEYYCWLSEQLYNMYLHTPNDERRLNLVFLDWEYENIFNALKLSIFYKIHHFTPIFLILTTYWDAKNNHPYLYQITKQVLEELELVRNDFHEVDDCFSMVDIYSSIGATALRLNHLVEAEEHFRQALDLYEQYELNKTHPEAIRVLYQNMGAVLALQNKKPESQKYYKKLVKTIETHNDAEGIGEFYYNYGLHLFEEKRLEEARGFFTKASKTYKDIKNPDGEAESLIRLAEVNIADKSFSNAIRVLNETQIILTSLENQNSIAYTNGLLSIVALGQYNFNKSITYAKLALEYYLDHSHLLKQAEIYVRLGGVYVGMNKFDYSWDFLQKALNIYIDKKDKQGLKTIYTIVTVIEKNSDLKIIEQLLNILSNTYSSKEIAQIFNNI